MGFLFALICSYIIGVVHGNGEAATVIYSKDGSCLGKEVIRAYSGTCTPFYGDDDASLDYFQFQCDSVRNQIRLLTFADAKCAIQTNQSTVVQTFKTDGTCQRTHSSFATVENNFQSVQVFCGGISLKSHPKTYQSLFQSEKIAFKHFTNYDLSCNLNPSVIELFTVNDCLYYPAIEHHMGTGIYALFNKEMPEGTTTKMISGQFYNNAHCRTNSGVIGPPDGGDGGIAIPVRRWLQGWGGGGKDNGPEQGGPEQGGPEDGPEQGGPEDGHDHEQQPEDRGPPEGEGSEVAQFDTEEDRCTKAASAVLGKISGFDSAVASSVKVSYSTYFDFTSEHFGNTYNLPTDSEENDSAGSTMSATTVLILWATAGVICGYGVVHTYGHFYGTSSGASVPTGPGGFLAVADTSGASYIKDAMQESSSSGGVSAHSRHGLLTHGNKDVNYEEEDADAMTV